jgi:hypothetical protein
MHPPLLLSELAPGFRRDLLVPRRDVRNTGSEPAELQFEGTSCACYGIRLAGAEKRLQPGERFVILPGDSATIEFDIATPTSAGEGRFAAQFVCSHARGDPARLTVPLTVPVHADLSAVPQLLSADYRPGEPPGPWRLRVSHCSRAAPPEGATPRIVESPAALSAGTWRMEARTEAAPGLWISEWEVDIVPQLPSGCRDDIQGRVVIEAPGGQAPRPLVDVSVLIRLGVGIRGPRSLPLGLVAGEAPKRRRVLLTAVDRVPFRVRSATSSDPRCRVTAAVDGLAARHWLDLEARLPDGQPLRATVVCETDHPESPRLEFAVTGEPAPKREGRSRVADERPVAGGPASECR